MDLQTISSVSQRFNISTRTLRYYEEIGLIAPVGDNGSAYRMYDKDTVARLQQIVVLRKLRIPLKQIADILRSGSAAVAISAFEERLRDIDDEITALSTIRDVLRTLANRLNLNSSELNLLDDESILEIVDSLTVSKISFKEEKTMSDLEKASEKLAKLSDKDVRIVYLPPVTVAAYQYEGDDPEMHVHQVIDRFVLDSGLTKIKPDLRHYGFNSPNPVDETGHHGYEVWVTIPDDMDVPAPIVKKRFEGGLYGAHMIPFGAFEEWGWLDAWMHNNDRYEYRGEGKHDNMYGFLEEALNYVNRVHMDDPEGDGFQLDLLVPIREKE